MARMGRPPTSEKAQVTVIRLTNEHVEVLDKIIREKAERALGAVVIVEPWRKVPGTKVKAQRVRIKEIDYSSARRELLVSLIEENLTDAVLNPTRVLPRVPHGPYSDLELADISTWAEQESLRMTETAPPAVQLVLTRNKLRRLERELPPEEYMQKLGAVTRAAAEAADNDEETP